MDEDETSDKGDAQRKLIELESTIGSLRDTQTELVKYVDLLRNLSSRYIRLMSLYSQHGRISVDLAIPEIKDSISKEILRILVDKSDESSGGMNISEISRDLKKARGSSSRRIVREKVRKMQEMGVLVENRVGKSTRYAPSERVLKNWYSILGFRVGENKVGHK
jgi:DNA-binding transcriptional ArsR family regulator